VVGFYLDFTQRVDVYFRAERMNTRQSLRLIAAAAAAANGGKQMHTNGNGSYDNDKGK